MSAHRPVAALASFTPVVAGLSATDCAPIASAMLVATEPDTPSRPFSASTAAFNSAIEFRLVESVLLLIASIFVCSPETAALNAASMSAHRPVALLA